MKREGKGLRDMCIRKERGGEGRREIVFVNLLI